MFCTTLSQAVNIDDINTDKTIIQICCALQQSNNYRLTICFSHLFKMYPIVWWKDRSYLTDLYYQIWCSYINSKGGCIYKLCRHALIKITSIYYFLTNASAFMICWHYIYIHKNVDKTLTTTYYKYNYISNFIAWFQENLRHKFSKIYLLFNLLPHKQYITITKPW